MKFSIRGRLMISFTAVITLVLVCQLLFNLFVAKSYYLTYQEKMIYRAYEALEDAFDGTVESIELAVDSYESNNNIEVFVWVDDAIWYTSYDSVLYAMGNRPSGVHKALHQPTDVSQMGIVQRVPQNVLVGGVPADVPQNAMQTSDAQKENLPPEGDVYAKENVGEATVLQFVDTFSHDNSKVMVAITLSLDSIESSAEVFSTSSMMISFVALLLGLGYSLILSKSITKPISEMQQVAGGLANLDFSRKANETVSAKELYQLSCSINSMSAQLEKAISELNIANASLQQDIDAQKQLEQMRREFVGNVSHEMKTPLTMLQIYAESLKYNIESVDKDFYCDTIMEETETLNELVASMLDISSIESGLSKMQMDEVDCSALLSALLERMQPILSDYALSQEIAPRLTVIGDAKYLEQAMKNYLNNAMEHTPKGGKIAVSLSAYDKGVVYRVENMGKAIQPEEMPRLWDSFYRSDKARSHGNKNVGLGLHIVKTVLDKHSGTCHCENTVDGVAFSFWIPCENTLTHIDM